MPQQHSLSVTYTTMDDGIHVQCDGCPWTLVVGDYGPRLSELVQLESQHQANPTVSDPRLSPQDAIIDAPASYTSEH
jgi:hypothetical protein